MLTLRKRGKRKIWHVRGTVRVGRETRVVKEHSCGTDRRDVAEAYRSKLEHDVRHEVLHGSRGRAQSLTIADAFLRYINRPGGVPRYDLDRINQINRVVGDYSIAQTAEAWVEFERARLGGCLPSTVRRWRAIFLAAINYFASKEKIDVPKLPSPDRDRRGKRLRFLSPDEADRLIDAYAPHARPIAVTLRWQGLRIGEALRLHWEHISWTGNSAFVAESKNGESRTVSLHERTRSALHRLWVERGSPKIGVVFLTQRGEPYHDPRTYQFPSGSPIKKTHGSACRRAGIANFRVHDWRHHWASTCVMAGIDLETIRQEGGWKSLRMVERYAAVSNEHRVLAMAKLK